MAKTQVIQETKAELVLLQCRNCDATYFQGPIQAGTLTDDGVFHAEDNRTQYQCLGCHAIQPVRDMRPRVGLTATL